MDSYILEQYGVSFYKQENGFLAVNASHPYLNLAILLNRYAQHKSTLPKLIDTINLALTGKYDEVFESAKNEWHEELGTDIYTGIIQNDMTFDVFMEDHYDETLQTFPLSDIKEILSLLLRYMETHFYNS